MSGASPHALPDIIVRTYLPADARALANIYYYTVHAINRCDYTQEQVEALAPITSLDIDVWKRKWQYIPPIVALIDDQVVGFTEFETINGHIDSFYVHHEFQKQGVGSALMNAIESIVCERQIPRVYAEVSVTAQPFFTRKGFKVVVKKNIVIRGCELPHFVMEKLYT